MTAGGLASIALARRTGEVYFSGNPSFVRNARMVGVNDNSLLSNIRE
jgi:hypothetical protein